MIEGEADLVPEAKVLEGLKKDEQVISAPYEAINMKISDGTNVQVVDKEKLYETPSK